jgi:hypothetical protein
VYKLADKLTHKTVRYLVRPGGRFEYRLLSKSLHSRSRNDIKKMVIGNERGDKIDIDPCFTLLQFLKRKRI